jgi:TRAP-type transport system small permease protein
MDRVVAWVERFVFPPIKIVHKFGYWVLFLLMFLTVGDIIGRYLSGTIPGFSPIPGTFELTEFALVVVVFSAIGYTQVRGEHISINVLTSHFPQRVQAILNSIMYLLCIVGFALIAWQSVVYAGRLIEGRNVSGVLSIPMYPFLIVVAIGSVIYCLALAVSFLKNLAKAVKRGA